MLVDSPRAQSVGRVAAAAPSVAVSRPRVTALEAQFGEIFLCKRPKNGYGCADHSKVDFEVGPYPDIVSFP